MRNIPHESPRNCESHGDRRPDHFGGDITETFGASAGEQTKVSHGKKDGEFGQSYDYHMV